MPSSKNLVVLAGMPLVWADVADSTLQMLDDVPMHELAGPVSGLIEIFEPMSRKLRPVLRGSECRFCKSVVVTHTRLGVLELLRIHAFRAAPGAARSLVHGSRCQHGIKPDGRCPIRLASGLGHGITGSL